MDDCNEIKLQIDNLKVILYFSVSVKHETLSNFIIENIEQNIKDKDSMENENKLFTSLNSFEEM